MAAYNRCCAGCGSTLDLCFDHVIPESQGGTDESENMQILCHHCNNRKNKSLGIPKLTPNFAEDSCEQIKKNREVFLMWLKAIRKSNIASRANNR
jgi:5-methylcytosine-specific restriction endonuclease McrA